MSPRPSVAGVCLLFLALACEERDQESSEREQTVEERAPVAPPVDDPVPAPYDLLPTVAEVIAVSSTTPSLRSGPRFLVDGSFETPWASRTGDDAAFVEVALPVGSEVHAVALTAGFTKRDGDADLFLMNLRVAAVRLLGDGVEVGRWRLDTESRELQRFELAAPVAARTWKLEILETEPGTRRGWREVCISELRLLGISPSTAGAGPAFVLGGVGGLAVEAIAQARVDIARLRDRGRAADFEDWRRRIQVGMRAYPMRCAFRRLRRGLAEALQAAADAEDARHDAHGAMDEVACPEPGLSAAAYDEIATIRRDARDALEEADWDRDEAEENALLFFDEWLFQCDAKLRGDEQEALRDWGLPLTSPPRDARPIPSP